MKASKYPLFTQKNEPSDAEIISHKLMLKAGLVRQQSSGQYSFLPVGLRVLNKIKMSGKAFSYSLEPGGQLEWASLPSVDLWKIQAQYDEHMLKEETLCKEHGINRLFLSVDPFFPPDKIELINSLKYELMHNEFIKHAKLGPWMMRNTTSVQLNIDFTSEKDANEMAYIADAIQPLLSILFSF